jgi:hypothetical protein
MRLTCGADETASAAGAGYGEPPEGEAEMTYPPPPGQPGQPDPNQPGGYPQSGGLPQQGYPQGGQPQGDYPQGGQQYPPTGGYEQQQYPQQGGYSQQYPPQGGYQPQPGYGQQQYPPSGPGFGGPQLPPQKSKTGLLVGIAIGVVVVVALVITGFVAPGFFLSKSSDKTASGSTNSSAPAASGAPSAPSSGLPGSGGATGNVDPAAKAAVDKFLAALNNKDVDGAFAMVCQSTLVEKSDITQAVSGNNTYKASSYTDASASSGVVAVVLQGGDEVANGAMTVQKPPSGGDYCVSTLFVAAGG